MFCVYTAQFYIGTLSVVYWGVRVYAAQFESLAGRWEEKRYDQLQPDSPGQHLVMMFVMAEQNDDGRGQEGGRAGRHVVRGALEVAGGVDFMKGGVPPADTRDTQTAET